MIDEKQALHHLIDLGQDIAQYNDLDILLERILTLAKQFMNAEAGSIYLVENGQLQFTYTQNDLLQKKLPLGKKLIYSTFFTPIDGTSLAGYVAQTGATLNIADAYHLPRVVPYIFNQDYDQKAGYRTQSVLTVPLKMSHGTVLGVLQLINARNENGKIRSFSKEEEPFIKHFANTATGAIERAKLTRALILRTIKMAEMRDPKETGPHVNRVGAYAAEIYEVWGSHAGCSQAEIRKSKDVLRMSAMLHDVGKVAISDIILKKPGKFNDEEYAIMKQHAYLGAQIFSERYSDFDDAAFVVALNHHERWDGDGYPGYIDVITGIPLRGHEKASCVAQGKKGEEIPLFGRIVAIADVYDALSCRRCYKEAWTEDRVLEEMRLGAGTHFDPHLIDILLSNLDLMRQIANRYPDDRE